MAEALQGQPGRPLALDGHVISPSVVQVAGTHHSTSHPPLTGHQAPVRKLALSNQNKGKSKTTLKSFNLVTLRKSKPRGKMNKQTREVETKILESIHDQNIMFRVSSSKLLCEAWMD